MREYLIHVLQWLAILLPMSLLVWALAFKQHERRRERGRNSNCQAP